MYLERRKTKTLPSNQVPPVPPSLGFQDGMRQSSLVRSTISETCPSRSSDDTLGRISSQDSRTLSFGQSLRRSGSTDNNDYDRNSLSGILFISNIWMSNTVILFHIGQSETFPGCSDSLSRLLSSSPAGSHRETRSTENLFSGIANRTRLFTSWFQYNHTVIFFIPQGQR